MDGDPTSIQYIPATLEKDRHRTPRGEALIEVYKKLRPGRPADRRQRRASSSRACSSTSAATTSAGSAATRSNKKLDGVAERLGIELPREQRTISKEDIAAIVGQLIELNNGIGQADDIDHLGNRRIRANGELIQNAVPHRPAAHGARRPASA
ncbi:MAG: hypothetical protein WKF78_03340 [Candidatus Limnocylindrales bacterium]